jgi:HD-GYP domain-containing protein (c-di-GMP phosphodiesterase class II)
MLIDYKKELEAAAKSMILIHDPDLLIKMTLRMVVQKIKVDHASILLHDRNKDTYILAVSRGSLSSKIPIGLARIDKDDALIRFFRERKDKLFSERNSLVYAQIKKLLTKNNIKSDLKFLLSQVLYQMEIFEAQVSIPSYFRDELLGLLLLGKKKNGRNFIQDELNFFVALASNLAMTIRNAQLFKELQEELEQRRQMFTRTTIALAAAIEAKDNYTHGHTTRVTNLSLEIARKISQKNKKVFDPKFLENLHIASLLHDIGKIGVPEYILNKRGELTIGERNKIKEHPLIGAAILKPIKELDEPLLGVKYHHEKYNGLGYPEGLKGEHIPLIAAIISVADSYDAMITDRPYRPALDKQKAIAEIERLKGKEFNPQVADAFIELCKEKEF